LKLGDEELRVFSISFSNKSSPVSEENFYDWCHIKIEPDIFATNKIFYLTLIKRVKTITAAIEFVSKLEEYKRHIIVQLK